jgi:hypothetical protein
MDINDLSPSIYNLILSKFHQEYKQDAERIKNKMNARYNPINQTDSIFIPKPIKNSKRNLSQEYNRKFAPKPQRPHFKKFSIHNNLSNNLMVVKDQPRISRVSKLSRKNKSQITCSVPKYKKYQKFVNKTDNYKNFYLDYSNSKKMTTFDMNLGMKERKQKINRSILLDNLNNSLLPKEGEKITYTCTNVNYNNDNYIKKEFPKHRQDKISRKRIFSSSISNDQISQIISPREVHYNQKISSKPCNFDFNSLSIEARKNAYVRYYVDRNASQW